MEVSKGLSEAHRVRKIWGRSKGDGRDQLEAVRATNGGGAASQELRTGKGWEPEHASVSAPVCLGSWTVGLYIVLVPFRQ